MRMKKSIVLFALIGLLVGINVASAQEGRPGRPGGPRGGVRMVGIQMLMEASTDATGLEPREILAQVRNGATLGEVIIANGGDVDAVLSDALAAVTTAVNERVESGNLTQEQGDQLLAQAEEGFQAALNGTLSGPPRPFLMPRVRIARHVLDLAAEQTGLEVQAIREQLRDGSSLATILSTNEVEPEAFIDGVMAQAETRTNMWLEQLRERLTTQINQGGGEDQPG